MSNALYPVNQWVLRSLRHTISSNGSRASLTTGESTSNSTDLAVKGIVAIQAMSQISTLYGSDDDAQHYSVGVAKSSIFLTVIDRLR